MLTLYYDGTDAIMLSGESANGDWPVESVQTMAKIAEETEKKLSYETAVSKAKTILQQFQELFQELHVMLLTN